MQEEYVGSTQEPIYTIPHTNYLFLLQKRHSRTFSEDDRIQAQQNVKKVEDDDSGEISEPEDPMMLSRDAKDWKASLAECTPSQLFHS